MRRFRGLLVAFVLAAVAIVVLWPAARDVERGADVDRSAAGSSPPAPSRNGGPAAEPSSSRPPAAAPTVGASTEVYASVPAGGLAGCVVDGRRRRLAGATVRVRSLAARERDDGAPSPAAEVTTATDTDGEFAFATLSDDDLELRAEAAGYAPAVQAVRTRGAYVAIVVEDGGGLDVVTLDGRGARVEGATVAFRTGGVDGREVARAVSEGAGRVRFDALPVGHGSVVAWKAGLGSGRAQVGVAARPPTSVVVVLRGAAELVGIVSDADDGRPVAGARVDVFTPGLDGLPGVPPATSDAEGRYVVRLDVGPGEVLDVRASRPAYADVRLRFPYDDRGRGSARCDFRLGRGAAEVWGRVVDAAGVGVVGVEVLFATSPGGLVAPGVVSSDDGRFALVSPSWFAPGTRATILARSRQGIGAATVRIRAHAGGPGAPVEIVLSGAGTVRGRVTDAEGRPAPGASVQLRLDVVGVQRQAVAEGRRASDVRTLEGLQDRRFAGALVTTTADDGRFALTSVPVGVYHVSAERGELLARSTVPVRVDAGAIAILELVLEAGASISGEVVGVDGVPIPGATVWLQAGPDAPSGTPSADARTGPDGRFELRHVAVGPTFTVHATAVTFGSDNRRGVRAGAAGLALRLARRGSIEGQVLADGRPPSGAFTVWVRRLEVEEARAESGAPRSGRPRSGPPARAHEVVAPDGRFAVRELIRGTYVVTATAPDGLVTATPVEVAVADGVASSPVTIDLRSGATLRGEVRRRDGVPAAGAVVVASPATAGHGALSRAAVTGDDGGFVLEGLEGGAFAVRVEGDGLVAFTEGVDLVAGETRVVRWVEREAGRLRVAVVDAEGRPVGGARVMLVDRAGAEVRPVSGRLRPTGDGEAVAGDGTDPWVRATTTDDRGQLVVEGLALGTYRVGATKPGFVAAAPPSTVDVAPGGVADVTVRMSPAASR